MKIVAFTGGVGGAKLVDGLAQILPPEDLTVVVNTGDDFDNLGLYICPDLDTICYTLAGFSNPETGWGRAVDTFHVLDAVKILRGEIWFRLGDKDLATHLERTRRLKAGQALSQITRDFCLTWAVMPIILPMSDQPVRTMVDTVEYGELPFQEYFVHRNCAPKVKGFLFAGIESAVPAPGVLNSMQNADAVIFCPSNPWVSIDPILAVKGIRAALGKKCVVAVSPIIGGKTVKGPAAKMYAELGVQPSALAVAHHYGDILSGFILDTMDAILAKKIKIPTCVTNTLMKTREDRRLLAQDVLNLIQS